MGIGFLARRTEHGDRLALVFADGGSVTYRELDAEIAARAANFPARRSLIIWAAQATRESILTYLAALALGHPVLPVAPRKDDIAALIATYQPAAIHGADGWRHLEQGPARAACHPDLALLLSTSGSTGSPKLVRLSRQNVDSNALAIAAYLELTPQDRSALILPLHYSYGLSVLHAHLAAGASVLIGAPSLMAPDFAERIDGCTNLSGVPYSFDLMEEVGFRDRMPMSLRFMTVAGGRLDPDLVMLYGRHMKARGGRFFVMYGQTEATARMAYMKPDQALAHPDCIGDAIPGGRFSLIDEAGVEIRGTHQAGELVYRGPNVMMGYATSQSDLARGADLDALKTGDLAERLSNGLYRLVGRRNRFSKIAGLRLAHDEIEVHLAHAGIAAFVTGDDTALVIAATTGADPAALRLQVAARTGLTANLTRVVILPDLPRHANGKPDYASILNAGLATANVAAGDAVMAAFRETFAPRRLATRDSFVSLGGDSLAYLQLSLALEAELGLLPRQWERLSIAALSARAKPAPRISGWRDWLWPAAIDSDHFLRAVAIFLVVLHHATMWSLAGGAATLLLLVGFNLARFHAQRLFTGDLLAVLRASLAPVFIYYPILLGYCIYRGEYPWQSLLLMGNWGIAGYSTMPSPIVLYWFVEAYLQIVLVALAIFAIPGLGRRVAAHPFALGLVFLAFTVLLRETVNFAWDAGEMNIFFTPRILYVPALGWCIYFAASRQQRIFMALLSVLLLLGLPWAEGATATILWVRAGLLIAACLVLICWARVFLPAMLTRLLSLIAAASFSIYLFHNLPYYLLLDDGGAERHHPVLHMVLGIACGICLHFVLQALGRRWRHSRWAAELWSLPRRRTTAAR